MFIILEGPDGAGKTTLAHQISELVPSTTILHRGPPTSDVLQEYIPVLEQYRPGGGKHFVADRWHLGERVYGPLLRGRSLLTDPALTHVDLLRRSRGVLVVLLLPPLSVLERRLEGRKDDLIDADLLPSLRRLYLTYRRYVDFTFEDEVSAQLIVANAFADEARAQPLSQFTTYIGPPAPETLLLGEKHRVNLDKYKSAFVPEGSTSGHFLLQAIGMHSWTYGLANALEDDVLALYETLQPRRVVALGKSAHQECERVGVKHATMPHPQYVRRFHHGRLAEYGKLLMEISNGEDWSPWPH